MAQKSHKFKRLKLLVLFVFLCLSVAAFWKGGTQAQNQNLAEKAAHHRRGPRLAAVRRTPTSSRRARAAILELVKATRRGPEIGNYPGGGPGAS